MGGECEVTHPYPSSCEGIGLRTMAVPEELEGHICNGIGSWC